MNLLALLGTVWLVTTPALRNAHDTIGFLGASVCQLPGGVVECLEGQDDAFGGSFPVVGLQYAQPIDGTSTVMLVVETPIYCEAFVVKRQGKQRMRGIAVMFDATCTTPIPARFRWTARRLAR